MNDVDTEISERLHELIDPERVRTDQALHRAVHPARRQRWVPIGAAALAAAAAVAVVTIAIVAPSRNDAPPFKLVGDRAAEVVVHVDGAGPGAPTAELTVGDTTAQGVELPARRAPGGLAIDDPDGFAFDAAEPAADVPDGSSLLVEGTFDSAGASTAPWIVGRSDDGQVTLLELGTWQLDSSGGSVVFEASGGFTYLTVEATIGSDAHYYLFKLHVSSAS